MYRTRSSENILKEFKLRKKQRFKFIEFNDSTMNGDLSIMSDLCDKLIKENLNLNWGGSARINPKMGFKFLRKMKKAGCNFLNYGIEIAAPKVLKKMNKQITVKDISKTVIKTRFAGIKVYSNWIVGFPNETEEQFEHLVQFLKNTPIDHVGIFTYSAEEGTLAAKFENQIPEKIKNSRRDRLAKVQFEMIQKQNKKWVGKIVDAIIEDYHPDSSLLMQARHQGQCPEVDNIIIINDTSKIKTFGKKYKVEITGLAGYDFIGKPVHEII